MRKLLYISLTFMLVTVVISCGRGVDRRLVLADTLMWKNPDSSLAILNAINRDSLQGDENLAYHALLLTQAQFRCNIPLTSDTLISKAVDYYSDNHNREHYTRALLYKGGAYEDMGNPVEAIKWYKQAEDNADSTDYRNLANINFRMGYLYYNNYASNNLDFEKFKKAYKCYIRINDEKMAMVTLGYIGNLYRANDLKKAIRCLSDAKDMAKRIDDKNSYYLYLNELSLTFFMDSSFVEAKTAVMECINNCEINNAMCFNAANAYSSLFMPDSAWYYFNRIDKDNMSAHDSMMYAFALSRIYDAENKKDESIKQERIGNRISDDIAASSIRDSIFMAEDTQNNKNIDAKAGVMYKQKLIIIWVSIIAVLLLISFLSYEFISIQKKKSLIRELNHYKEITDSLLSEYKENTPINDEDKELHGALISYLEEHFDLLKTLVEQSGNLKHSDFVKLLNEKSLQLGKNKDLGKLLKMLADYKFNNLIQYIYELYPELNETDLKVVSLISLGYDNNGIAFCMGMTNKSVRTKKTRLKHKMKLPMSLDAFITQERLIRSTRK